MMAHRLRPPGPLLGAPALGAPAPCAGLLPMCWLGLVLVGVLSMAAGQAGEAAVQFRVSVTYLLAGSLILGGALQLWFARFIAARLAESRTDLLLPNFNAVSLLSTAASGLLGCVLALTVLRHESTLYRLLMLAGFVVTGNIWVSTIFLNSTRRYRALAAVFLCGYGATAGAVAVLASDGLQAMLAGFVGGQLLLLAVLAGLIHRTYRSADYIAWDVLAVRRACPSLMLTGVLCNLALWLDKLVFWLVPQTSQAVLGPLRGALIYDLPWALASVCALPGMAVFLLRVRADFVACHEAYRGAVLGGAAATPAAGSLRHIRELRELLVHSARSGLYDMLKIQAGTTLLVFAFGAVWLRALGWADVYLPLLRIDAITAGLQVLWLAVLTMLYQLDRRAALLSLGALYAGLNGALSWLSLNIGPHVYGYGAALAALVSLGAAVYWLDRCCVHLEFDTYMARSAGWLGRRAPRTAARGG
jgi:uncharacterized membrane protein